MGRKRWKEEEIIEILRNAEKGDMTIGEVCRSFAVSEETFYKWRKRFGGMEKSEVRTRKDLEKENTELKKALGEYLITNDEQFTCAKSKIFQKPLLLLRHFGRLTNFHSVLYLGILAL